MINFRKAMKGISFLLCLGFFVYSGTAVAKTSWEDVLKAKNEAANACASGRTCTCPTGDKYADQYNSLGVCLSEKQAAEKADAKLNDDCRAYETVKAERKKCLAGEMKKSEQAYQDKTLKDQLYSTCQTNMNTFLNSAKDAYNNCKEANKKQADADEKNAANAKAQQEAADAEKAYNDAVTLCEHGSDGACAQLNDLYKKHEKAAKAAGKTATKADKANSKADAAYANTCESGLSWNKTLNKCTLSSTANAEEDKIFQECLSKGSDASFCTSYTEKTINSDEYNCGGMGKYDSKNGTCSPYTEEEQAAKEKEKQAQEAYQAKLTECSSLTDDAPGKADCEAQLAELGKLAGVDGYGDTDVTGEKVGGVTQGEIAAAKGYKDCMAAYPDGKLGDKSGSTYNIFKYIACRITAFVADLRGIVYALAGFGLIFCAYNAIMGKLSFKHLGTIAVGLFILSMTTSFIEYILFDGKDKLEFGQYLPDGNHGNYMHEVTGADFNGANCADDPSLCPDTLLQGLAGEEKGWDFWNDIGSTISSIADGIGAVTNAYSTVSNLYDSASSAISNIKDAINGENDQTRAAEDDLNKTREGLADAQQKLAEAQEAMAPAQAAVSSAQSAYDAAVAQVNQDREEINAMQKALNSGDYSQYLSADTKATVDNAQKALDAANKAVEEQQASLAANQAKLAELQDALNTGKLETEIASSEKKVADLQAQIDALDPSRPAQAAQIEQLKKAQAEAQAKADAARERLDAVKAKYGDKTPEQLQAMIAEVKADIEDDNYLLKQKHEAVRSAQKDLTDANTAAKKEVQNAITEKNKELQSDQAALNDANKALNQAQSAYNTAESKVKAAKNSVEAWEGAVAQAQANYDAAKEGAGDFLSNVGKVATNVAALTSNVTYTANTLASTASRVSNDINNAGKSQSQLDTCNKALSEYQRISSVCSQNPTLANKCKNPANKKDLDCVNHPQYYECGSVLDNVVSIINEKKCTTGVDNWLNTAGSGILNGLQNASNNANQARDGAGAVNQAYQQGKHQGDQVSGTIGDLLGAGRAIGETVSQGASAYNNAAAKKEECEKKGGKWYPVTSVCSTDTSKNTCPEGYKWSFLKSQCVKK